MPSAASASKRRETSRAEVESAQVHKLIPENMSLPMAAQQFSLFRFQLTHRRFDDETLRILESVLVCKDVKSLIETRSSLREFMRSESLSVIYEIAEQTVHQKLFVLEFLVRAFALIGDIESVLALKYEALLLRDLKSPSCQWLQVSSVEWLNFAQQSLCNGFHSIARKACENALLCLPKNNAVETGEFFEHMKLFERLKKLKDHAERFAASGSVQAQASEYMKRREVDVGNKHLSVYEENQFVASSLFRNGLKMRNARKLHECQRLQKKTELSPEQSLELE